MNTPTILPGTVINGCKVIKEIGAGGMGTVYKGIDEILSRNVAIKIMHQPGPNSTGKARFLREASAIANLDHKGIIKIYSYGEHENRPFFVMEYVNGWSLKDFISRYNYIHNSGTNPEDLRLAGYIKENDINGQFFLYDHTENLTQDQIYPKKVRKLLTSAVAALGEAHRNGIIHRDIKSSNILVINDDNLKLIDFGLVKQSGAGDLTKDKSFMGTLSYAAPEQLMGARGEISFRTDIYSMGVVMYELATLTHPTQCDDEAATVTKIALGNITPPRQLNPNISQEFEKIIMKCLSKDPAKRYANGKELESALLNTANDESWFSSFTQMLRGWFAKENSVPTPKPAIEVISASNIDPEKELSPAEVFLKSARKKFYRKFAVMEAIDDLRQAYELEKTNTDILFLLCFALMTVSANSDLKSYINRTKVANADWSPLQKGKFELIETLFLNRNYEKGLRIAERLSRVYPNDYDLQMAAFLCLETLGNYPKAIETGKAIEKIGKQNNIVPVALSECYLSIMDFDNAINALQERISKYPDLYNLQLKVIQSLLLSGKCDEAKERAKQVSDKDPQNMFLLITLGRALACSKDYEKSFEAFRRAVGVKGDDGLRAWGYYYLYLLSELMGTNGARYLKKAKELKPTMNFLSNPELKKLVEKEDIISIQEELYNKPWLRAFQNYAHKICIDTMSIRSHTIGNYGVVSMFEIDPSGACSHHRLFCNFNPYDVEEQFGQLWLSQMPVSAFLDKEGNIVTTAAYKIENPIEGHLISLKFDKPWEAGSTSYIYCRQPDLELIEENGIVSFELPPLPQPARREQAFLVALPNNAEIQSLTNVPDEKIEYKGYSVLCFKPYLRAGETFNFKIYFKYS